MASPQTDSYMLGATQMVIGLSATVQFVPSKFMNGMAIKIGAGSATLAIVSGLSAVASAGYALGSTEVISVQGPSTFFLAAAGSTMTASIMVSYSSGYSLPVGG